MNWFVYLVKTPWVKKKQDWAEYRKLKQDLKCAKNYFWNTQIRVKHTFFEEESYDEYDACFKYRTMLGRNRLSDIGVFENLLFEYEHSRCLNFVPVGDEKLCQCSACGAYPANKEYYDARQNMLNIQNTYKHFWKNKFNQNTK